MSARLFDLLHRSAEAYPERPAFVTEKAVTPYRELDRAASRFAAGLRQAGVRQGERVVLMIDGTVEYLIAYYGVLRAGAIAVPVAPDMRGRSLLHLIEHCGAVAAIVGGESAPSVARCTTETSPLRCVIALSTTVPSIPRPVLDFATLAAGPGLLEDPGTTEHDVAAIHYTSGTTGQPKGAMLTHRNLVANVNSIVEYLELGPSDVAAMVLPFYYVYGSSVLHTHLAAGGSIVPAGTLAYPATVLAAIQKFRCTGFAGVPSTYLKLLGFPAFSSYDLSSLRYLTNAGAAMSPPVVDMVTAKLPHARLFLMYGQTEATARLSYLPPEYVKTKRGSAGKAIPGVELAIRDAEGRELPRGELGEIVARGANIMLGYWADPVETARVLRPEGLRTGDMARMDEEGFLFISGRASEMIKSGGRRISPLEIEEVLLAIPGVAECAVIGEPDPVLGEAIAAYVVAAPGATLDERTVLRGCLDELPRAKLPVRVRFVASLPRTHNGKVRRMDLRQESRPG